MITRLTLSVNEYYLFPIQLQSYLTSVSYRRDRSSSDPRFDQSEPLIFCSNFDVDFNLYTQFIVVLFRYTVKYICSISILKTVFITAMLIENEKRYASNILSTFYIV